MADRKTKNVGTWCTICPTAFTSAADLCQHVVAPKHKKKLLRSCPGSIPHMYKLQYFFDTYMAQAPLVGLEFIEENQGGSRYQYSCLLCGFHGARKPAFLHITGPAHIEKYILKHCPALSVENSPGISNKDYLGALQNASAKVCHLHGKKKIQEIPGEASCPIQEKIEKYDPFVELRVVHDQNGDLQVKPVSLETEKDQCGFSGNWDFFDYLQKFEIRNNEDAWIMKQIAFNCRQALAWYWHD